jgi:Lanthionine-containing peptide SapB precursor RamS
VHDILDLQQLDVEEPDDNAVTGDLESVGDSAVSILLCV